MAEPVAPPRRLQAPFDRRDVTPRQGDRLWGDGIYRRRILVRTDGDSTTGELEDDFHHFAFAVRLGQRHLGGCPCIGLGVLTQRR